MAKSFPERLAALRRERGISQRQAAAALLISQALLSHYETGAREPGLSFVCRACDYYQVSADYLLGRSEHPDAAGQAARAATAFVSALRGVIDAAESELQQFEEQV